MTVEARPAGSARPGLGRVVVLVVTLVALVAVLIPLAWAVVGSLKTEADYRQIPTQFLPREISFEAYQAVLADGDLPRGFLNSVIVTGLEVAAVLLTSSVAGYVFARKLFWGKDALFLFVLASTMVPFTMLLIPLYLLFIDLGFSNNYLAIVLPTAVSAYGIFLCRQFIRGIPGDLFDAAVIDGAGDLQVYREIVIPLARPVLSALAIFTLITSFNSLIWPLVIVNDSELFTLPLVLNSYARQGEAAVFTQTLAAAVLGSIPLVVAFLVLQRNFVRGISLTGMGGH
jgi:ABC-type glycerol-3-phosphate transport system permease component